MACIARVNTKSKVLGCIHLNDQFVFISVSISLFSFEKMCIIFSHQSHFIIFCCKNRLCSWLNLLICWFNKLAIWSIVCWKKIVTMTAKKFELCSIVQNGFKSLVVSILYFSLLFLYPWPINLVFYFADGIWWMLIMFKPIFCWNDFVARKRILASFENILFFS